MSYLNDIEGLRGENLASAALAHLLMRSEPVRRAFIELVSAMSPVGPIIVKKQFAVFTEVATEEKKRVDLLIQTDDAVIGIENKFGAGFQEGQPNSYVELVKAKAEQLSGVWGTGFQPLLVVLAPESRNDETDKHIAEQGIADSCVFLSWEALMKSFSRECLPDLPPVDRFLADELAEHVKAQTGAIDLPRYMQHIDKTWQDRGSAVVKAVYGQVVWPLLDSTLTDGATYSGGKHYHGYIFSRDESNRAWIGFMNSGEIAGIDGSGASLVVALYNNSAAEELRTSTGGQRVDLGYGWEKYQPVVVPYKTDWTERSAWEPLMKEINTAMLAT